MSLRQGNNIIAGSPDEHRVIDFQEPTSANNYTWYRKYMDGWVEQGGEISSTSTANITVSLPITMGDSHYTACVFCISNSTDPVGFRNVSVWNRTTTSFECREQSGIPKIWEVKGMAAN